MTQVEIRHFHLFGAIGGGAKGFNRGKARVGEMEARFRCIGSVDVDLAANRDFLSMAGVPATLLDMFDRDQYRDFHGSEPPADWKEATPQDIQRAAGGERPHIVFLSAPCKGFSGLLSETRSKTAKYQALNRLTLRGVWLMLEAWKNDPPELVLFENVPRIATRGRHLLDQIVGLLRSYGYATAETTHDCGELGGLAQSRKRFLLVARHAEKVPAFLYVPEKKPLRAVGEILGRMPLPGDDRGGPMHRVPSLQWKTWVRLAFVKAGSDWRSLNELAVDDGNLRDYLLVPEMHNGAYGVRDWSASSGAVAGASRPANGVFAVADPRPPFDSRSGVAGVRAWRDPSGTIQGESLPSNGAFSVADPRFASSDQWHRGQQYGVHEWTEPSGAIAGQQNPGQGRFSVADPRMPDTDFKGMRVVDWRGTAGVVTGGRAPGSSAQSVADPRMSPSDSRHANVYRVTPWTNASGAVTGQPNPSNGAHTVADPRVAAGKHNNCFRVVKMSDASPAVTGGTGPSAGGLAVADPRGGPDAELLHGKYPITPWDQPTRTVIAGNANGAFAVADPRPGMKRERGDAYLTGGHYGVVPWEEHTGAVSSAAGHDNGRFSVADPRMPESSEKLIALIRAEDGTWHRPFTTLELAALQSLIDPEETLELDGLSDSAWRERIGNAVPPEAAAAIASVMGMTLLLAWSGETFILSAQPIWVRPIAVGLSMTSQVA